MHSRKKRIIPPTADELLAEKQRLEKIQKLHKLVFAEIEAKNYTDEALALSEKAMMISPDIYSFLNFRRNIILAKLTEATLADRVKVLTTELELLTRIIKESPKSYTLWYHRQWLLLQSQNITEIMARELALCDYMLKKDNRNFHVWNYRSWVVGLDGTQSLNEEMEFTKSMICRDFSNFSAWHYRTKVVKQMYGKAIPIEFINSELEMLKNAYFTCPNDQSVWNYHRWLLLGLELIKIVGISPRSYSVPPESFVVGFSHNISQVSSDVIGVSSGFDPVEGTWQPISTKPFSYIWQFTPTSPINGPIEIRLSPINTTVSDCNGHQKFTELIYKFKSNGENFDFFVDGVEDVEVFEKELKSIDELLDIEDDNITEVLLRKAQILEVLACSVPESNYFDKAIQCYSKLKSTDSKHAKFYDESLDALDCLKFNRKPQTQANSLKIQAKLLILD